MPAVLKELMRHSSIDTTMKYYVGQNAEATADELWQCHERAAESVPENVAG
jgi:integrase